MAERFDLVVLGMGSGGLVAAELGATVGLRVAAVEHARIGGDCLWTGCVPSKTLLASAHAAHAVRTSGRLGIRVPAPEVDGARVWQRIEEVRRVIEAESDNAERFEAMGVDVVFGTPRLAGPRRVEVDGRVLETRFVLVATGSRPAVPPVPGLVEAGFLTSESVFELGGAPASLVVVGGGPVGVELAQAFARLGTRTTLLQRGPRLLPRDEPELTELLTEALRADGVDVRLRCEPERVTVEGGRKVVHARSGGTQHRLAADEILVAAGRRPNVDGLGLEEAGVRVGPGGIEVDRRLRSSVRSIYAAGDVAGRYLFTHAAATEAAIAVRNMFFPGSTRAPGLVPWATFTDPELAHVGMTAAEAIECHGEARVSVRRIDLAGSDRGRAEGLERGALLVVTARGRVAGAHMLAPSAGEMVHELGLLVRRGGKLLDLSSLVHVYPTLSTQVALLVAEDAFEAARRFSWLARLRSPTRTRR